VRVGGMVPGKLMVTDFRRNEPGRIQAVPCVRQDA